jgi:chaperonin GroES
MHVKKGDKVIYAKYIGNEVEIDGEELVILRESDILGIVEK